MSRHNRLSARAKRARNANELHRACAAAKRAIRQPVYTSHENRRHD